MPRQQCGVKWLGGRLYLIPLFFLLAPDSFPALHLVCLSKQVKLQYFPRSSTLITVGHRDLLLYMIVFIIKTSSQFLLLNSHPPIVFYYLVALRTKPFRSSMKICSISVYYPHAFLLCLLRCVSYLSWVHSLTSK